MSNQDKPSEYLKVKIQTAKPTELLMMLFDGAIRFTAQAKGHIEHAEYEKKHNLLMRAQEILLELIQALDRGLDSALYERLIGLYRFCYDRLVQANLRNDLAAADEALTVLAHLKETWRLAIQKYQEDGRQQESVAPATAHSLCLEG